MVSQDIKERTRRRIKRNYLAKALGDGSLKQRIKPSNKESYKRKRIRKQDIEQYGED